MMLLILLLVLLPTSISADSCISCDPFFFTRLRTFIFGEYNLSFLNLFLIPKICPDFGLFLFDVVSDILNGKTFIDEGQRTWGLTVIGLMFLPMTVVYAWAVIQELQESVSWRQSLLILLLAPIIAPIAIPLLTVFYISFVAFVFAKKCVQPDYKPNDPFNGHMAELLKLLEGVLEANFQAALGLCICLVVRSLENCFQCKPVNEIKNLQ